MNSFESVKRQAFTLVELLVVIAIIGILIGMLLPAVQSVREAARRTECSNKMRNIGIASLNHEATFKKFPNAGSQSDTYWNAAFANAPLHDFENLGWAYQILPFLEGQNLFDQRTASGPFLSPAAGGTPMAEVGNDTFRCPSRGNRLALNAQFLYPFFQSDYAGVIGPWTDAEGFIPDHGLAFWIGGTNTGNEQEHTWTGIIAKSGHSLGDEASSGSVRYKEIKVADVQDGLSNTILVMEKAVNGQFYDFVETQPFSDWWESGLFHNADYSSLRIITLAAPSNGYWAGGAEIGLLSDSAPRPEIWQQSSGRTREIGFGSAHPGVTMSVAGDGSVQAINNTADMLLLINLGRRADGFPTGFGDL